jgi:DNA mismatch repair protein MutL
MKAPPPLPSELSREMVEEPIRTIGEAAPGYRISGEVFDTYLVVEQEAQITFIDKHAAHERLHFDRMKAEGYRPMAQSLLEPVVLTLPPEEGEVLRRHLSLLEVYGFLVEDFGGGSLVLRQVPFDLDPGEAEGVLEGLARALLVGNRLDPTAARDHLLHSMACKTAIKGGQKTKALELGSLVEAVLSGEVKYCPHGRPVAITLTRAQLERQFGRA